MNIIILTGRLTKDAELKYTNGGAANSRFSLAVDYRKKVGDKWENSTNFFNITLWGKQAEGLTKYLLKGREVKIEGELVNANYEKDGQKVYKDEIRVKDIELGASGSTEQRQPAKESEPQGSVGFDDDIPF